MLYLLCNLLFFFLPYIVLRFHLVSCRSSSLIWTFTASYCMNNTPPFISRNGCIHLFLLMAMLQGTFSHTATHALCQNSWGVCLEMEGLIWRIVSNEVQSFSSLLIQVYFYHWNLRVSVSWQPWQLNCCQYPGYKLLSWYILSWIPVNLKIFLY